MKYILGFEGEYGFLSNFYPSPITVGGDEYPTVEHAYQASKTTNIRWRDKIRMAATPAAAKRYGRLAPQSEHFDCRKVQIMRHLLQKKFARGSVLAAMLLATGDAELEETNWWGDEFWGVCNGIGYNMLGRLLMEIRTELQNASPTSEL